MKNIEKSRPTSSPDCHSAAATWQLVTRTFGRRLRRGDTEDSHPGERGNIGDSTIKLTSCLKMCYSNYMPRKSRTDAPGAFHHIIARGIERSDIFKDNADRNNFLNRLSRIIKETNTRCFGWALIPNHFHLLLKTGDMPISTVMRRLLTG
ncbi:MAG: transposase, partial [Desulfobacterales bacterium]|nr:transposase [Desulfobacterales bacterium]